MTKESSRTSVDLPSALTVLLLETHANLKSPLSLLKQAQLGTLLLASLIHHGQGRKWIGRHQACRNHVLLLLLCPCWLCPGLCMQKTAHIVHLINSETQSGIAEGKSDRKPLKITDQTGFQSTKFKTSLPRLQPAAQEAIKHLQVIQCRH